MSDQNKAIVLRIYSEILNQGNLDLAEAVLAADLVDHYPHPGIKPGRENIKQGVLARRAAFPDLHFTVDDLLADADRVIARWTMRGTHRGAFSGIPPTGRSVVWTGITIFRFADGKVVERWLSADDLGLLRQLDATPTT